MGIREIKNDIETCKQAEKDLVKSIEPFLAYWELVQHTKKQLAILAKQRKYLYKELEKFSTQELDTEQEEE